MNGAKPENQLLRESIVEHSKIIDKLTAQRDALLAACENAVKQMESDPVKANGEWEIGLFCGLEDMDITDRYEACRHGYDKALDKVRDWIIGEIEEAIAAGGGK